MAFTKLFGLMLLLAGQLCCVEVNDEAMQTLIDRVDRLEERNVALERKNKELEHKVSSLSNNKRFVLSSSEGPVAFTARINPYNIDHIKPQQIIVFETDITNIGGAYNNSSGVFVAPHTGIYTFSCSLLDSEARADGSGVMLHAEIVKDHVVLARIFAHAEGASYRDQGAQTVFSYVRQGEQVWVRSVDNSDVSVGGEMYSTFSGYLLYQME